MREDRVANDVSDFLSRSQLAIYERSTHAKDTSKVRNRY
jgi:hypothetical protein